MIRARLNYCWRLIATGFGFVLFAVGGIVLSYLVLGFIQLVRLPKERKSLYMRRVISTSFRFYINFLKLCGLLTYEVQGIEKIKQNGQLILANHPSLLDVVFLFSITKQADCIVKDSLWKNALTRPPVNTANYVSNASEQLIADCINSLESGNSLIIFPEGTRSSPGEALKFHRGASNIALLAKKNITPILIHSVPSTLKKDEKWYQIPESPPHFTIKVLDEFSIEEILNSEGMQSRKGRRLNRGLENYFMEQLEAHFP